MTSSCDKNHVGALFCDFLLQTRNRQTCEVVWRWVQQFINAAPFYIKNPVVDIRDRMESFYRIDLFPAEDSPHNHFIIRVWGPESHHDHICFSTEFDGLPRYIETGIHLHNRICRDQLI